MRRQLFGLATLAFAGILALAGCVQSVVLQSPDFVDLVRRASPAVVGVSDDRGVIGTGFRLIDTRFVVTAAHLLHSARGSPSVVWEDRRWPVRVLRTDVHNDLAVKQQVLSNRCRGDRAKEFCFLKVLGVRLRIAMNNNIANRA